MGTSFSHPPQPLVEVHGPRNKVLVPAGTSLTVNPPHLPLPFSFPRHRPRPPIYHRARSPYPDRTRGRPRERGRRRPVQSETESEMSFMDVSPPRGRMRGGNGRRFSGGGGVGVGRRGMRAVPVPMPGPGPRGSFDPLDARMRSAPDLAGYGGMGRGMMPPRGGGMSPGLAGGMGPGMGGGNPYAGPPVQIPVRGSTPFQARGPGPVPMQGNARPPMRAPGVNDVPAGVYAARGAAPPPHRANTEPLASTRLNRGQHGGKKVGPSGQEWIEGDPFLDACTCTTNCTCRKGHRVLYRSQAQDGDGHNGYGEIRYVLKDDLGKDCGDHSKCHEREREGKKNGKKKGRNSDESQEFQDEMRDCLKSMRDDLRNMKLKDGIAGGPSRPPFRSMLPNSRFIDAIDPRAPRMLNDPYGMPGHLRNRPDRIPGIPLHGPLPNDISFEDDMPYSDPPFGIDPMMDPMDIGARPPPRMGGRHPIPPDFIPPPRRMRGRGGHRMPPGPDMDIEGFGSGPPPMAARGMGGGPRGRFNARRRPPPFRPDGDDMDDIGMGMRGERRGGRGEYGGEMDDDDDEDGGWEDEHDNDEGPGMRQSPGRRGDGGGRARMGHHIGGRPGGGGRQAHVDDGDEDEDV